MSRQSRNAAKGNAGPREVEHLLAVIRRLPGNKILTLVVGDNPTPFVIDVNESGVFGYERGHELLLRAKLHAALTSTGGLMIRQFSTSQTTTLTPADGRQLTVPWKNLYGVALGGGCWIPMSAPEVEWACTHEAGSGRLLAAQPGVSYCDLPTEG